jgi:hypothetical protein
MSLSDRILSAKLQSNVANRGCRSCDWFLGLPADAQALINEWLDGGFSMLQLHTVLIAKDDDSDYPPLPVSDTAWRSHARHHNERCRGDQ